MKHFYWIAALVLLTFAGDRIGGVVLKKIILDSKFRYSRMYGGQANADILLVGNSRGLSFYQPYMEEMTGLSTFNISYSAMPMNLAEVLVRDYLARYEKPEYLFIDVTICDRLNPQLIAGFNCYSSFSDRLDSLIHAVAPSVSYGGKVSHLFRYNSEIFQRAFYYSNKMDEDWLLDREISSRLKQDIGSVDSPTVELVPEMLQHLAATVKFAEEQDIKVKLVVSPYYFPFAERIKNLDAMVAQVEAATGMEVHDYSRAIKEPEDFGDYQHINVRGSRTYIQLLRQDGVLP